MSAKSIAQWLAWLQQRWHVAARLIRPGALLLGLLYLSACVPPDGILQKAEDHYSLGDLSVVGTDLRFYHEALTDAAGVHLDWPGYVIGIEKIYGFFGERQVTHILSYDSGNPRIGLPPAPCLLTSVLWPVDRVMKMNEFVPACDSQVHVADPDADFAGSTALKTFRDALTHRLQDGHFTHILVVVMGWNTVQSDAMANANQVTSNLARAAAHENQPFRPLIIIVTWPSQWSLGDWWAVPTQVIRSMGYWSKRYQSGDVGRRFLQPIVKDAVLVAREQAAPLTPVVMIGHSFGARSFIAMFRDWATISDDRAPWELLPRYTAPTPEQWHFRPDDRMILLEAAFDIGDLFMPTTGRLIPALRSGRPQITLTSSIFDTAFSTAIWGDYAGSRHTYASVCLLPQDAFHGYDLGVFQCREATSPTDQKLWGLETCSTVPLRWQIEPVVRTVSETPIRYYDASKLINCQMPFGGGGAHGDFYRQEMGYFLWSEIVEASTSQQVR